MRLTVVSAEQAKELSKQTLGIDLDLDSVEGMCAILRRTASLRSPISRRALVFEVERSLRSLFPNRDLSKRLNEAVESLISVGDLVERVVVDQLHVFTSMPRFVAVPPDQAVVLGCRPDGVALLAADLPDPVCSGALRTVTLPRIQHSPNDFRSELSGQGLVELSLERWMNAPRSEPANKFLERMKQRAQSGNRARFENVQVFRPDSSHQHYRSRFVPLDRDSSGTLLVRYPRDFGPDGWAVCEVNSGDISGLFQLPSSSSLRGCDEAWRYMAAADAHREQPLPVRVREGEAGTFVDLFSPPPSWIEKYLLLFGERKTRANGSLFSFSLRASAIAKLVELLETTMWANVTYDQEESQ